MIRSRILITAFALIVGCAGPAFADEVTKPIEKAEAKTLRGQTRCPVMGGKIDSAVYTDIQGQRVYHCCPGCAEKLIADPEKYFKKAAADGILFENIQTACPVTGKPIDKHVVMDYEGRRVYFADGASEGAFLREPAKYLAVLDVQVKAAAKAEPPAEKK